MPAKRTPSRTDSSSARLSLRVKPSSSARSSMRSTVSRLVCGPEANSFMGSSNSSPCRDRERWVRGSNSRRESMRSSANSMRTGPLVARREDVHNAAAHAEVAPLLHQRRAREAQVGEPPQELLPVHLLALDEARATEVFPWNHPLHHRRRSGDQHRRGLLREPVEALHARRHLVRMRRQALERQDVPAREKVEPPLQRRGAGLFPQEERKVEEKALRLLDAGRQHYQRAVEPPGRQEDGVGLGAALKPGDALLAAPLMGEQSRDTVVE